jgi:hypothetical protein
MVQARERFAFFEVAQHFAAAKIFRIGELESSPGRCVAREQLLDVSFELRRMAYEGMVQEHNAHSFLP